MSNTNLIADPTKIIWAAKLANAAYGYDGGLESIEDTTVKLALIDSEGQKRGFISENDDFIVIAIAGTKSTQDFITDAQFVKQDAVFCGQLLSIHSGFLQEFESIRVLLDNYFSYRKKTDIRKVIVTGHSLGGAVATLIALHLVETRPSIVLNIYTFGSPRVGSWELKHLYNKMCPNTLRVVHDKDIVPKVPKLFYWHVNTLLHLNLDGSVITFYRRINAIISNLLDRVFATVSGEAVQDHSMTLYIQAVENFAAKQSASACN